MFCAENGNETRGEARVPGSLEPSPWKRYGSAVLPAILSILIRVQFRDSFGNKMPFLFFFLVILFAGTYGGFGPALLALSLEAIPAVYFYVQPEDAFHPPVATSLWGLGIFVALGLLVAAIGHSLYLSRRRVREAAREVEDRMRELQREIARERHLEGELRESEGRFRLMGDVAPMMMWMAGPDKRCIWVNRSWLEFTGHKPEEEVDSAWGRSIHPDDRQAAASAFNAAFDGRRPCRIEYRLRRHDGVYRWILDSGMPSFGPDGALLGYIGTCVDISEIKDARDEAQRSEARLRLAFEASKMGAWDWDLITGKITWSESLERIFGFAPGGFEGDLEGFLKLIHPGDRPKVQEAIDRSLGSRSDFSTDFRIVRTDGSTGFLLAKGKVVCGPAGRPVHMTGVAVDLSDLQVARGRMAETEAVSGTVLKAVLDGIIMIDERGVVMSMNPAAEKLFGYAEAEVVGQNIKRLMPSPYRDEHDEYLRRYLETGEKRIIGIGREVRGLRKDGTEFPMTLAVSEVRLGDRRVFTGLIHDITDQKRAAEELTRAKEAAESAHRDALVANRMKDEFLATLSHELRTPLSAILGWARLLREGQLDEKEAAEGLQAIERNSLAQAKLIEDLLDVSRIISGKLRLEVQPIDLGEVVDAAIGVVRPAAEGKEIHIERRLDPAGSQTHGDPARLAQVVWNLLSNAVKFTPKGGWVRVETRRVESAVEILVSDNGIGISPDALPYVFDRFRQADTTPRRRHGGLGLGLAIVRHLVELHGGSVEATSPGLGKGATFRVRIPLAAPPPRAEERNRPPTDAVREFTEAPGPTPPLDGLRVLVVDDEPDARRLLETVLTRCQAEVETAASAAEAIAALADFRPDVILSDIAMPDEDGYELIRRIRSMESEQLRRTPAVALTAYARTEDRNRALAAGFQMHLAKPVEPAALATAIASLVGRR
jgi:PAS domain S-box-containing protein